MPEDNITIGEQLSDDLKSNESLAKFVGGNADNLAKSYLEIETKMGSIKQEFEDKLSKTVELPGEDADDNARRAFFTKLGCPEKPEGYSNIEIEGVDKVFKDDDESIVAIRNACHKANIPDSQYKAVMTEVAKQQLVSLDTFVKQDEAAEKEAVATLTQEWGGDSKYKEKVELARRLVKHYDSEDSKVTDFLQDTRLGSYSPLVKLLGNIAADMIAEETTFTGGTPAKKTGAEVELSPVTGEPLLQYDKSPELK